MIRPRNNTGFNQTNSQYNNILTTQTDNHETQKSNVNRLSKKSELFQKNYDVLCQFLKAFQNDSLQRQIAQLNSCADFKQQWQNKRKKNNQLKYSYFFRQNFMYLVLSLILLIIQIILIWFLSVFRVFGFQNNQGVFTLCLIVQIIDISIKSGYILYYNHAQIKNQFKLKIKDWFEIYFGNVFSLIYCFLGFFGLINNTKTIQYVIIDITVIIFSYNRIQDIYKDIKMIKSSSYFKNYVKLLNLMGTLIMIIHFFAVLMYLSTNFSQNHFLDEYSLKVTKTWVDLYVYSFYFSGTTVLTVGYGDILPKNNIQIFIVLLMQIFGVVMIVYLNGQVGNILCSLRRQTQNLQNDLSVLQRLKNNFKLSFETTQKIRQYLIDNRRVDEQYHAHQQKILLQKISSDLRQQAILTNHINIIKQSLFLLVNFSVKAQIQISNKLIHVFYSPNQKISQILGKQKLFFVKKGKISLYLAKNDNQHQSCRKIIKTIDCSQENTNQCNTFGYVSLILGRLNRLKAFSNDFSNVYYIQKNDFIQSINCDNKDFQKYHQMKQEYLNQQHPEKNQSQLFFNSKEHYVCEISKIISEYLKFRHCSKRKNIFRKANRGKLILQLNGEEGSPDQSQSEIQSNTSKINIDVLQPNIYPKSFAMKDTQNSCLTLDQRRQKYKQYQDYTNMKQPKNLVVQRKYAKRYCKNAYIKKKADQVLKQSLHNKPQQTQKIQQAFQIGASFTYFYVDFNLEMVMRKVNYYTKVLSIFTNMFQQTLAEVNRQANINNGEIVSGSCKKIQKYRRQKDFLQSIKINF